MGEIIEWDCQYCKQIRSEEYDSAKSHLAICQLLNAKMAPTFDETFSILGDLRAKLAAKEKVMRQEKYKAGIPQDAKFSDIELEGIFHKKQWDGRIGVQNSTAGSLVLYKTTDRSIISRAVNSKQEMSQATVTSFTKLVYSLYIAKVDRRRLEDGKRAERKMPDYWEAKGRAAESHTNWSLLYKDGDNKESLRISRLAIGNQILWGRPDLVFINEKSNELMIVERKCAGDRIDIPDDGWPNLRAQLWAYSHIDSFRKYSKIHLVGEIWKKEQLVGDFPIGIPKTIRFDINNFELVWPKVFQHLGGRIIE